MECEPTMSEANDGREAAAEPNHEIAFNEIVRVAFENTLQTGMLLLEAEDPVGQEPYLLIGLLGAVLAQLAPEAPAELQLYTYDALGFGCAEIRGCRSTKALPEALVADARAIGVRLTLVSRGDRSSVLVSVRSGEVSQGRAA
jgi:hypothetical protein